MLESFVPTCELKYYTVIISLVCLQQLPNNCYFLHLRTTWTVCLVAEAEEQWNPVPDWGKWVGTACHWGTTAVINAFNKINFKTSST